MTKVCGVVMGSGDADLNVDVAMILEEQVRTVWHHPAVRYNAASPVGHRV